MTALVVSLLNRARSGPWEAHTIGDVDKSAGQAESLFLWHYGPSVRGQMSLLVEYRAHPFMLHGKRKQSRTMASENLLRFFLFDLLQSIYFISQ